MTSKRKYSENRNDMKTCSDQENIPPENVCSPLRKRKKKNVGLQTQTLISLGQRDSNCGSSMIKPQYHQPLSVNSSINGKKRIKGEDGSNLDQKALLSEESPQKRRQKTSNMTEKVDSYFPKAFKTRSPTYIREKSQIFRKGIPDVGSVTTEGARRTAEPRGCEDQTQEISKVPHGNQSLESRSTGPYKLETPNLKTEGHLSQEEWESDCEEIGRSVCKIIVDCVCQGTGSVLFSNVLMTNAHLFKGCIDGKKLLDHIKVSVVFEQRTIGEIFFTVKETFVDIDEELDYAFLELIPEGQIANQPETVTVPPGLLKKVDEMLGSGKVCIIGYPQGREKTFVYTPIIEEENRNRSAREGNLAQYKDFIFTQRTIEQSVISQDINEILSGGSKAKLVITYFSEMHDGTSGSVVIDERRRLIGLHIGGYILSSKVVIEVALPLLLILEKLVRVLRKNGNKEMLEQFKLEMPDHINFKMLMLSF